MALGSGSIWIFSWSWEGLERFIGPIFRPPLTPMLRDQEQNRVYLDPFTRGGTNFLFPLLTSRVQPAAGHGGRDVPQR